MAYCSQGGMDAPEFNRTKRRTESFIVSYIGYRFIIASLCVQLNVLFCCLWRNVEASTPPLTTCDKCHKLHKCHKLRRTVVQRRRIDNTWPVAAGQVLPIRRRRTSRAVKQDIGSESRFLPTQPAFNAPVKGFPSEYRHPVW